MKTAFEATRFASAEALDAMVAELLRSFLSLPEEDVIWSASAERSGGGALDESASSAKAASGPPHSKFRRSWAILSGGKTPMAAYRRLAESPPILAPNVGLTYTDERHVPPDSPESNYGNTLPMLRALRIPEERILRVRTDLGLEEAAAAFERDLGQALEAGAQFPLALLGLGEDGHTCSLFTQENLKSCEGRLAVAVRRANGSARVSIAPDLLARVRRVIFLVTGPEKAPMLRRLLEDPRAVVAGQAVARCPNVEVWHAEVFDE